MEEARWRAWLHYIACFLFGTGIALLVDMHPEHKRGMNTDPDSWPSIATVESGHALGFVTIESFSEPAPISSGSYVYIGLQVRFFPSHGLWAGVPEHYDNHGTCPHCGRGYEAPNMPLQVQAKEPGGYTLFSGCKSCFFDYLLEMRKGQ